MSIAIASTNGAVSKVSQRQLFRDAGLPIVPGTVGPVFDYAHLEGQLGLAKLLGRDGDQSHLLSSVWLKAPRRSSHRISSINDLYLAYANVRSSHATDVVVEQFFDSAYLVNIQLSGRNNGQESHVCHIEQLRNYGYPLTPDALSALNQGIGVLEKMIPIAVSARSIANIEGKVTVKFLVDPETSNFFVLKAKKGFDFQPPPPLPPPPPEEVELDPSTEEIASREAFLKKAAMRMSIPSYILDWTADHGIKRTSFVKLVSTILEGSETRRQSFRNHLLEMPNDCETEIKLFLEIIKDDEKLLPVNRFLFQILVDRIDLELEKRLAKK